MLNTKIRLNLYDTINSGKITVSKPQLFLVCQESTTAIKWLNAVDKMMVGPSESLYRRWL